MKNFNFFNLVLAILTITGISPAQTLTDDTLAVRAILAANGLATKPLDNTVVGVNSDRVIGLYLNQIGISNIPADIGKLTAVTELAITASPIADLPPEFGKLKSVYRLNLWGNKFTSLPAAVCDLTNLQELFVNNNSLLTTLPPEIGNLTKLTKFEAYKCALNALPPTFANLIKLTRLTLQDNNIPSLPQEIGNLTKLDYFLVYSNKLATLPSTIGNLVSLKTFHVSGNLLNSLPASIININPSVWADFTFNYLDSNTLSTEINAWLDKYSPSWRAHQFTPIIFFPSHPTTAFSPYFLSSTPQQLRYYLPKSSIVTIHLLDAQGRMLSQLANGFNPRGENVVFWDAGRISSGTYILRLKTGNGSVVQKITAVK